MQLSLSRFFSDRVVFDGSLPLKLRITNSFWDWCKRMISWIYSPASYTETNRKTVQCFKKYLVDTLGAERLQKISSRYSVDFDRMEKRGSPLLSRHVAQMVIGSRNMGVEDISNFRNLNALELDQAIQKAQDPFRGIWKVEDIKERISGKATEWLGRVFYDPFLADRERLQLCREHPAIEGFEDFLNHMVAKVIKREMDVGTLVPAQNQTNGTKQYYVVRGKVVTGEGMVSYILDPATQDTNLPSIRLFRGTGPRNGEIDGISSLITDFESDLGRSAYESGIPYERYIENKPTIEAGHSLGGNLVQWRAAHMTHVKELYSFSSPGIPVREAEKFNREKRPLKIVIRQVDGDRPSRVGGAHLGWKQPGRVDFEIRKSKFKLKYNPHVAVFKVEKIEHTVKTIVCEKERDRLLFSAKNWVERLRSTLGPPAAVMLRVIRKIKRTLFSSRAELERGLKLGFFKNGKWQVERFGPFAYNPQA